MKKFFIFVLIFCGCAFFYKKKFLSHDKKIPVVGVVQIIEHPALDQTRKGIFDEIEANGFKDKVSVDWRYESAQNNPSIAAQIVQKFIGDEVEVIVAIPTLVSQTALQLIKQSGMKVPLVFASVTDPVSARILHSDKVASEGVTGVSNYISSKEQFSFFKRLLPELKSLGVIYNPGEANSVILLEEMEKVGKQMGIEIFSAVASRTSDVSAATQSLIEKVDAIFINNDNTALAAFDSIVVAAKIANIPVFVSDVDCVKKGALAAIGADQYALGRQAGKMVVKILKDVKNADNQVMEYPEIIKEEINHKVAQDLKIIIK